MRAKTLLALLVLAHALAHPLAHALPLPAAASEQAQGPASSLPTEARLAKSVPCAACVAHRVLAPMPAVVSVRQEQWQPLAAPLELRVLSSSLLTRPARAPPLV